MRRDSCELSYSSWEIENWVLVSFIFNENWELKIENCYLLYSMKIWIVEVEHRMVDFILQFLEIGICEERFVWIVTFFELRIENWVLVSFIFNENLDSWSYNFWKYESSEERFVWIKLFTGNLSLRIENWELSIGIFYIQWKLRIGIFYVSMKIWIVEIEYWMVDLTIFGNRNLWGEILVNCHILHG